jgi:hypothetical protein
VPCLGDVVSTLAKLGKATGDVRSGKLHAGMVEEEHRRHESRQLGITHEMQNFPLLEQLAQSQQESARSLEELRRGEPMQL